MVRLEEIHAFVLDMDGTIFLGERLLPGAQAFFEMLTQKQIPYLLLTNNSSKAKTQYAQKLQRLGLSIPESHIFTSGDAAAIFLKEDYAQKGVYLVGTPALEQSFRDYGYQLTDQNPAAVVLGFDTTLTYQKLWQLCDFVRAGVPYFATHPDINCPTENGYMPDIGAMIAFVETSTGRKPDQIIGKPNFPVVDALKTFFNCPVDQLCMIGDRLYTDIALGQAGMKTVLVLSGETKSEEIPLSPFQPDVVVDHLAALFDLFD